MTNSRHRSARPRSGLGIGPPRPSRSESIRAYRNRRATELSRRSSSQERSDQTRSNGGLSGGASEFFRISRDPALTRVMRKHFNTKVSRKNVSFHAIPPDRKQREGGRSSRSRPSRRAPSRQGRRNQSISFHFKSYNVLVMLDPDRSPRLVFRRSRPAIGPPHLGVDPESAMRGRTLGRAPSFQQ